MILTIDIGNTNQTYSLYSDSAKQLQTGQLTSLNSELEKYIGQEVPIKTYVSSVRDEYLAQLNLGYTQIRSFFKEEKFLDMPVSYSQTIGDDRLINAYAIYKKEKSSPAVIIDTGSFTTIDYITHEGLQGGHILPGLDALEQCYQSGNNLKSISHITEKSRLHKSTPTNTREAIEQGVLSSFYYPILEIIKNYSPENIIITGGNAPRVFAFLTETCHLEKVTQSKELVHESILYLANSKDII